MALRRLPGRPRGGDPPPDVSLRRPATRRSDLILIPAIVGSLGLLSVFLVLWINRVNEINRGHADLVVAIMEVQVGAATFHLRIEEHISQNLEGIQTGSVGEVRKEFERSLELSRAILAGGPYDVGSRLPLLDEPGLRFEALGVHEQLQRLGAIAEERLANLPAAGAGTALDQLFDGVYQNFLRRASALKALAADAERRNRVYRGRLAAAVISLWAIIIGSAAFIAFRHQRARLRAEADLLEVREALERANRELETRVREKTESLQETNAALTRKVSECGRIHEALLSHQDRLRELTSQLTLAEERERRRIATELHDRIGTGLAFAKMKLLSFPHPASGGAAIGHREVTESVALIEQAIEDARSLSFELSAPALYELGLESALKSLAERTEREHHIQVEVKFGNCSNPLAEDVRVLVFRAVRELLANVIKHARASHAQIECRQEDADLWIAVVDDGIGFQGRDSPVPRSPEGGFGLFSIRERLGSLGGALEVESSATGSKITLIVPLAAGGQWEGGPT